jgi:transcriptional regulator with XRE-family HTH domain
MMGYRTEGIEEVAEEAVEPQPPAWPEWTLGDRMRKARDHAGLSQDEMGQKLTPISGQPVKHTTIATWERDVHQPRNLMAVLELWAEVTNVDLHWLVFGGVTEGADNPRCVDLTLVPHQGQMALPYDSMSWRPEFVNDLVGAT